jgi:hypothetical protein
LILPWATIFNLKQAKEMDAKDKQIEGKTSRAKELANPLFLITSKVLSSFTMMNGFSSTIGCHSVF